MSIKKLLINEIYDNQSKKIVVDLEELQELQELFLELGVDMEDIFNVKRETQINESPYKMGSEKDATINKFLRSTGSSPKLYVPHDIHKHDISKVKDTLSMQGKGKKYYDVKNKAIEFQLTPKVDPLIWNPSSQDFITEFLDAGKEYMNWYYDIHQLIFSSFDEKDGCMFLLFLAATSPQTGIVANFYQASTLLNAFKHDIKDEKIVDAFRNIGQNVAYAPTKLFTYKNIKNMEDDENTQTKDSYEVLKHSHLYKVATGKYSDFNRDIHPNEKNVSRMGNLGEGKVSDIFRVLYYYFSVNETPTIQNAVQFIYSTYNIDSKTTGSILSNLSLGSFKVTNFALNLLKPDYSDVNFWKPVAIDTWMIQFFFPMINDKNWKIKNNLSLFSGTAIKYHSLTKKVIEITDKLNKTGEFYGMKDLMPQQIQAMLWASTKKQIDAVSNRGKTEVDLMNVIQNRAKLLNIYNANLKELPASKIREIISSIGIIKTSDKDVLTLN